MDPNNNPVRRLIRAGKLRAGPDHQLAIKAIWDGDEVLVSTDSENEVDQELVKLLGGDEALSRLNIGKVGSIRSGSID